MGGAFRAIFSAPVKIFKAVAKTVGGKKPKKRAAVATAEKVGTDITEPIKRTAALGSGYAGGTIMTSAQGVEEGTKRARTLLGSG